ncbi:spore germination protein [Caldifermentibacillus hisashii]|uniref:spore germination protein n=1 Tax=Caldifermentibacillus hisashii TaxID=996558 RepID=UPI0034D46D69
MQTKKKKTTSQTNMIDLLVEKLEPSFDIINQKLQSDNKTVHLLYLKTVVDNDQIQNYIIKPFFEMGSIQLFDSYIASLPQNNKIETNEKVLSQLSRGSVLVQIQEQNYLLDLKKITTNLVLETNIEPTIQGPELGLSEDIQTNLNIIRHRYHNISLKIETHQIGTSNNQTLAILYDQENVNDSVLKNLQEKVKNLKHSVILSSSELQRLLNDKKWTFMPIMMITERSDRVIQNIAGGKVVLILDGTPNAIIAPSVFFDFMTSMDDKYLPFGVSKFLKVLRYFGLFICLLLPGVYVAVTSYNPEVLRSELAFSVAGSRVGVPFPSFIEVLFLLVFMELLTEASIRLPRAVSGTATTVGGLILGTAATEAALTSNIMVIIVSAVAIATFAIPINEMSFAIRIVRYVLLFFGTTAGITGLILSFLAFVLYLTNLESFGEPYLKLFVQRKKVETKGVKS